MPARSTERATARPRRAGKTASPAGDVEKAVLRDLKELAKRDERLAASALAASAVAMAREVDTPGNSATSKSMCAKALADVLETLRELAPAEVAGDKIDEIGARRAARVAGRAAT